MNIYELASDPDIARLIAVLYEGYLMPYDELVKEMNIKPAKLNDILEASEGLWDTPSQYTYKLTERGEVAYGIIKSRNVKIIDKKETIKKEKAEMPTEKLKTKLEPVKKFIDTWKVVIRTPATFFENMPVEGGYKEPLKFVLFCYLFFAIFSPFLVVYSPGIFVLYLPPVTFLSGIIIVLLQSIIVHTGVIIFAGYYKKGFESTLRVISYSSAPLVFLWIPVIGIIFLLYSINLVIKGLMEVHKTTKIRALFAIFGLSTFIGIVAGIIVIYLLYSGIIESSIQLPEIPEI